LFFIYEIVASDSMDNSLVSPLKTFFVDLSREMPNEQWKNCANKYNIPAKRRHSFECAYDLFLWLYENRIIEETNLHALEELLMAEGRKDLAKLTREFEGRNNARLKQDLRRSESEKEKVHQTHENELNSDMDVFDDIKAVPITINGKAFSGSSGISKASSSPTVVIEIKSNDFENISVEIIVDGALLKTVEDIKPGSTREIKIPANEIAGFQIKHCRWRPGLFRLPGAGGGDCYWTCPRGRSVKINLVLNVS